MALPPAAHLDKAFATITMKHHYSNKKASELNKNKVYILSFIDTGGLELLTSKYFRAQNSKIQKLLPESSQRKK
jgi:hypothetical protein